MTAPDDRRDGKRVLVLGGSGALGGAVCRALAAEGARLAFTYHRRQDAAESLARDLSGTPGGALALALDLARVADIAGAVHVAHEALGGIDALVQCAGVAVSVADTEGERPRQRVADIDEAAWDRMHAVNVKGAFFACREVVARMRAAGAGGELVLVGSIDGAKPVPTPAHYAASKAALRGMAQAMAKEFGRDGIRVNVLAPGLLDGGIARSLAPELVAEYLKHCALRRAGRLPEVAQVAAWLALENTYVTGQTILVDGAL
jgi:NAD(P)-dependent dehydrogenase (short-subunit alcohol dehydrogenase family)